MADRITKSIRVNAPIKKVYETWSRFENFPLFMENIKAVWMIGPRTSIWEAEGPLGSSINWKAETVIMQDEKQMQKDLDNFKSLLEDEENPKTSRNKQ